MRGGATCPDCNNPVRSCTCHQDKIADMLGMDRLSKRGVQWNNFSVAVLDHIEHYTVPQYGDAPNDPASGFSAADFMLQIKKYVARLGSNARGPAEAQRDLLKIAHYCAMLHDKQQEDQNVPTCGGNDS